MAMFENEIKVVGNVIHMDLWYPGIGGEPDTLQLGLTAVRSADDIRIFYEFGRDGWVVQQNRLAHAEFEKAEDVRDDWTEVAFVQAWAFEPDGGDDAEG